MDQNLTECVNKYLEEEGSQQNQLPKALMDEFPDEPAYKKFKATLNSSAKFESLVCFMINSFLKY